MTLAACEEGDWADLSAQAGDGGPPPGAATSAADIVFPSEAPVPQFTLGRVSAREFLEVGFSLHCGASRNWFRQSFPAVAHSTRAGQRIVMFSHVVRTDAEMAVGKVIMAVGPARYGDAMMAVLALTNAENRGLSAAEVSSFLPAAGYARSTGANDALAEMALTGVRVAYEAIGVRSTPYVSSGG